MFHVTSDRLTWERSVTQQKDSWVKSSQMAKISESVVCLVSRQLAVMYVLFCIKPTGSLSVKSVPLGGHSGKNRTRMHVWYSNSLGTRKVWHVPGMAWVTAFQSCGNVGCWMQATSRSHFMKDYSWWGNAPCPKRYCGKDWPLRRWGQDNCWSRTVAW